MKKTVYIILFLMALNASSQEKGSFTDKRDNQVYQTVTLGNQTWMAQNLNFKAGRGCFCYDNNEDNCAKYGRLYTFQSAQNVCPEGWHLPTQDEFKILKDYMAVNFVNAGTSSGFNRLAAGQYFTSMESFNALGEMAYFWTSTDINDYEGGVYISGELLTLSDFKYFKNTAYSVRCVKDYAVKKLNVPKLNE